MRRPTSVCTLILATAWLLAIGQALITEPASFLSTRGSTSADTKLMHWFNVDECGSETFTAAIVSGTPYGSDLAANNGLVTSGCPSVTRDSLLFEKSSNGMTTTGTRISGGKIEGAVTTQDNSNYLSGSGPTRSFSDLTYEFWIKPNFNSNDGDYRQYMLLENGELLSSAAVGTDYDWLLGVDYGLQVYFVTDAVGPFFRVTNNRRFFSQPMVVSPATEFVAGDLLHVVITDTEDGFNLYVNDVEEGPFLDSVAPGVSVSLASTHHTYIGSSGALGSTLPSMDNNNEAKISFKGDILFAAIHEADLSASVNDLYTAFLPNNKPVKATSGTVERSVAEDGQGNSAIDFTDAFYDEDYFQYRFKGNSDVDLQSRNMLVTLQGPLPSNPAGTFQKTGSDVGVGATLNVNELESELTYNNTVSDKFTPAGAFGILNYDVQDDFSTATGCSLRLRVEPTNDQPVAFTPADSPANAVLVAEDRTVVITLGGDDDIDGNDANEVNFKPSKIILFEPTQGKLTLYNPVNEICTDTEVIYGDEYDLTGTSYKVCFLPGTGYVGSTDNQFIGNVEFEHKVRETSVVGFYGNDDLDSDNVTSYINITNPFAVGARPEGDLSSGTLVVENQPGENNNYTITLIGHDNLCESEFGSRTGCPRNLEYELIELPPAEQGDLYFEGVKVEVTDIPWFMNTNNQLVFVPAENYFNAQKTTNTADGPSLCTTDTNYIRPNDFDQCLSEQGQNSPELTIARTGPSTANLPVELSNDYTTSDFRGRSFGVIDACANEFEPAKGCPVVIRYRVGVGAQKSPLSQAQDVPGMHIWIENKNDLHLDSATLVVPAEITAEKNVWTPVTTLGIAKNYEYTNTDQDSEILEIQVSVDDGLLGELIRFTKFAFDDGAPIHEPGDVEFKKYFYQDAPAACEISGCTTLTAKTTTSMVNELLSGLEYRHSDGDPDNRRGVISYQITPIKETSGVEKSVRGETVVVAANTNGVAPGTTSIELIAIIVSLSILYV